MRLWTFAVPTSKLTRCCDAIRTYTDHPRSLSGNFNTSSSPTKNSMRKVGKGELEGLRKRIALSSVDVGARPHDKRFHILDGHIPSVVRSFQHSDNRQSVLACRQFALTGSPGLGF
jgi:hypothetical protein